jgi:hypothetical protein
MKKIKCCTTGKYFNQEDLYPAIYVEADGDGYIKHIELTQTIFKCFNYLILDGKEISILCLNNENNYRTVSFEENEFYINLIYDHIDKFKILKRRDRNYVDNIFDKTSNREFNYLTGTESRTYTITNGLKYTFGVELELYRTSNIIRKHDLINVKEVYDGSIRDERNNKTGKEYVTGVLTGDDGIMNLQHLVSRLAETGYVNKTCSVHVHIGNCKSDKLTLFAYLTLCYYLEGDLMKMMPHSRRNNRYCHSLRNNFNPSNYELFASKKYNELILKSEYYKMFRQFFNYYPDRCINKKLNSDIHHHLGYDTNTIRYCWVNPVNMMLNIKNLKNNPKDIEFRLHSGTLNFKKIKNWILICMAIVKYAEDNAYNIYINGEIPNLKTVLTYSLPKTGDKLYNYYLSRVEHFMEDSDMLKEKKEYRKIRKNSKQLKIKNIKNVLYLV